VKTGRYLAGGERTFKAGFRASILRTLTSARAQETLLWRGNVLLRRVADKTFWALMRRVTKDQALAEK